MQSFAGDIIFMKQIDSQIEIKHRKNRGKSSILTYSSKFLSQLHTARQGYRGLLFAAVRTNGGCSANNTYLGSVVCSARAWLRPWGTLFAVVPCRAQIPISLVHRIPEDGPGGTVVAGQAVAGDLRQTVGLAESLCRVTCVLLKRRGSSENRIWGVVAQTIKCGCEHKHAWPTESNGNAISPDVHFPPAHPDGDEHERLLMVPNVSHPGKHVSRSRFARFFDRKGLLKTFVQPAVPVWASRLQPRVCVVPHRAVRVRHISPFSFSSSHSLSSRAIGTLRLSLQSQRVWRSVGP